MEETGECAWPEKESKLRFSLMCKNRLGDGFDTTLM